MNYEDEIAEEVAWKHYRAGVQDALAGVKHELLFNGRLRRDLVEELVKKVTKDLV
jgi:hypothetical protein